LDVPPRQNFFLSPETIANEGRPNLDNIQGLISI
jgi:hypothetical protein